MTLDEIALRMERAKHQSDRLHRWRLNHKTAAPDEAAEKKALQRKFAEEIKFWRDVLARRRRPPFLPENPK